MKYLISILSLFIFSSVYAEPINTVGIPLPLNDIDSVSIYIDGYSYYLNEATKVSREVKEYAAKITPVKYDVQAFIDVLNYTKNITPAQLNIIRYELSQYDVETFANVVKYTQNISPEVIQIFRYQLAKYDVTTFKDIGQWIKYIETYQAVKDYGTDLKSAVSSVRVSHYIKSKDYVKLRAELAGVIPVDKVEALIRYSEGKIKAVRQPIEWVLWKDAYTIDKTIPQDDIFLLINELNIGYEKLYDRYFSNHQGKTMVVFSWDVARENYIRQYMYQFIERYENKIYAMIPNYGVLNNIDDKGDYTKWVEPIGQVIAWVKSNTNLPVGLTVCQVRDDSDVKFHDAMKDLQYDFVYLWGLHDFNYDFGIEFGEANRWANGRPVILGGFFGNRENPLGQLPEAILEDISYKFPSFMAMRKSEGWMGIHIIGDRWNTILTKCKDRGIVLQ